MKTVSVMLSWEASKQVRKYILNASQMHAAPPPPPPQFIVMVETSTFGIIRGQNFRGRNVRAKMSVAKMSEHQKLMAVSLLFSDRFFKLSLGDPF